MALGRYTEPRRLDNIELCQVCRLSRLSSVNILPETMQTYYQLAPQEQTLVILKSMYHFFFQ